MYHHFILLHSDYSEGRRMAFHSYSKSITGIVDFLSIMENLKSELPHLSFGFHHLQTKYRDWESVYEYDMFFKDVFPVNEIDVFTRLITADDQVSALDVANLITSKISCTHLKLQKLLYFFYCEFIKDYGAAPFKEKFEAWDYGPVIGDVYDEYKKYGRTDIEGREDDTFQIIKDAPFKLSVYSRFKKSLSYGGILKSLDATLNKYGDMSAGQLVDITHLPGSPWHTIFDGGRGRNQIIPEELIKKHII